MLRLNSFLISFFASSIFLLLIYANILLQNCFASSSATPLPNNINKEFDQELIKILETKLFIVADESPPYNFYDNKNFTGISVAVVKNILSEMGISKYLIKAFTWTRAIGIYGHKGINDQNNPAYVLIIGLGRIPQRENQFKWVGIISPYTVSLFALSERIDIKAKTLNGFQKYRIGVVSEDVKSKYLLSKNFNEKNFEYVRNNEINFQKLLNKRIDIIPMANLTMNYFIDKFEINSQKIKNVFTLDDLSSEGLYLAFSKNTPDTIVEKFRITLEKIKATGEYDKIIEKYLKK